jgi:hypothetical protein
MFQLEKLRLVTELRGSRRMIGTEAVFGVNTLDFRLHPGRPQVAR